MGKWQLTMDPVQEWGEEVEDGVVYGVTLHRESAPPDAASSSSSVSCVQYRTLKVRRVKAAPLERLVSELLNPKCDEPDFPRIFLSTYRAFTCTNTFIEMLFQREDKDSNPVSSVRLNSAALSDLVHLWLEEFSEDLRDSPQHPSLRLLSRHLRQHLCFRRLNQHTQNLLHTFQDEDKRSESEALRTEDNPVEGEGAQKDSGNLLSYTARDIAEELTRLDAALFMRVVPCHCLGCIWSQRDKKENQNLAPTVRATIAQFNSVTNWVISSLLCPSAMFTSSNPDPTKSPRAPRSPKPHHLPYFQLSSTAQRARLIEKWISVAQECHQLRNFSSLRAILSALQSNSVYRLKKTWAAVSRESVSSFDQLCESFPDENCVLTNKEILEDGSQQTEEETSTALKSPKLPSSPKQTAFIGGEVPYLGTYLTVLTMLDTALPDTLEGGLINFEKRRREFEVLSQIKQLQASCSLYTLPSHPGIVVLLNSCSPLGEQQSYDLSRELEPPVDSCPGSPNFWSQRLITKKLGSLLSSAEGSGKKTQSDQISVSSSGSSGSEIEDFTCSLRHKVQSGSSLSISADSSGSCSSAHSSSQPDLSSLSSEAGASSSSSPSPSNSAHNKQPSDSCIIRVSMELDSGNVYKSIQITSQDKASQVVQRALEKHHMEYQNCSDFSLVQILQSEKELLLPDNANVFYAMCPSASNDFILRQRSRNHSSCSSPAGSHKVHHAK